MSTDLTRLGQYSTQELDELQRGHETAPTLETLEGVPSSTHGERREIPIPHPGERPNAVRADLAEAIPSPEAPEDQAKASDAEAQPGNQG